MMIALIVIIRGGGGGGGAFQYESRFLPQNTLAMGIIEIWQDGRLIYIPVSL